MAPRLPSARPRVLVIDDNPDSREYLEACLEADPYDVHSAAGGKAGLEALRADRPDAVLLDLGLTDMPGIEVLRAIKTDPLTRRIPVLALTVASDERYLAATFEAGADDYLLKPFRRMELVARLRARIAASRGLSPDASSHEALLELTRLLASSLEMSELLHLVAARTAEALQVDRCAVVFLEPDGERAVVAAASEDATVHGLPIHLKDYPEIREVVRTGRPLVVGRVEEHESLQGILPLLATKRIGSLALFPMSRGQAVDGVLFLRSERFQRPLEGPDLFFADAVASAVALAVRNVRVAEELRRTKQFMELLIDSSTDAILATDPRGVMLIFNQGAERLLGWQAAEVIGKLGVAQFFPSGPGQPLTRLLPGDSAEGSVAATTRRQDVVAKNGEVIPVQLTAWSVTDSGREVATAAILVDLRERLRIERKLSQAQDKIMRSEQQAVLAELAGAMAHELNQPLTSILGYAEMAKRKRGDVGEVGRIVDIVIAEAERMADLVRKIGRITKYETKSYVGEQRIVDLEKSSEPD
ncbi:MAG TPA: response regulator [Myxococcota bacterium]|nr:response regulator [Myxococcota bacterium]HRY95629.1 response regulator [Myxococcota bacterium]HSA20346.1 response regulator [Myxococcota bacterium]